MSNELIAQELADSDLELVTGGHSADVNITVNNNVNISFTQNNYNVVFAPVYVYGTVTNSNIDNGNVYVQGSHILGGPLGLHH